MSVIITNVLPTPTTLAHVPYSGQTSMSPQAQQQMQQPPSVPMANPPPPPTQQQQPQPTQQQQSQPSTAQPPTNPTPNTPNPNNQRKEGFALFNQQPNKDDIIKMFGDDKNKYDMSNKLVNYPVGHPLHAPQTLADVRANDSEILVQRENMIFGMALAGGVSVVVLGLLMSSGLMSDTPSGATL